MLVYGDQPRREAPRDKLARVAAALAAGDRTRALIEAGELAQGLADAEFSALGEDDDTPVQRAALGLCIAIAAGKDAEAELAALRAMDLAPAISVKTPEGYAFYALYPDSYALAARRHPWTAAPFVIGLRSIGTSLAAVVAAAVGASQVISLRPTGHPFRREVRLSKSLRHRVGAHEGPFAIVDEGPGLSGSSFGAVADALEALGVGPERLVFLPGHAGELGPKASPAHRERWRRATRLVAQTPCPVAEWFADVIAPPSWSADVPGTVWKIRLGEGHVARFAGLSVLGEGKLARARALHAAGFCAEPLALRRGLLLQRWAQGATWTPSLEHLGRYLRFRREALPASRGADAAGLIEMARVNVGELLGEDAGRQVAHGLAALPLAAARPKPVHVDARLHRQEWVGGVKLDALDHSQAHDLVGPQDIAWDVAGAEVEFDLDAAATRSLAEAAGADPVMLELFRTAYPAFQAGLWRFAGDEPRVDGYRARLARQLSGVAA